MRPITNAQFYGTASIQQIVVRSYQVCQGFTHYCNRNKFDAGSIPADYFVLRISRLGEKYLTFTKVRGKRR